MTKSNSISAASVVAVLALLLPLYGQNNAASPAASPASQGWDATKLEKLRFYYHTWKKNEIKVCETYSGSPGVVVCDSDDDDVWTNSLMHMIGDNNRAGMTEDKSYGTALAFAAAHGKTFLTSSSQDPWPKPQTGITLTVWGCNQDKDKNISCSH
jgi:hypothetical protein